MAHVRQLLLVLVCAAALVAGCGTDSDEGGTAAAPEEPAAPSTSQADVGSNRFGFALFDNARKSVQAEAVALYSARPDGSSLRGPYVARRESIGVSPQYQSRQAAADLEGGDTIYVADVPFRRRGDQVLTAVARMDGRLVGTSLFQLRVGQRGGPPEVGDKAIKVDTLTEADVGGDLSKLSTRVPPAREMHQENLADVLGKKPVVLLFATPQLCKSRICGPVVDIAEQVRAGSGKGVTFIHQEVFIDNDPNKGYREPLARWGLTSEPWAFVIDRTGKISARFEGAFSTGELARAVEKVK
jgi:hypothetical protein